LIYILSEKLKSKTEIQNMLTNTRLKAFVSTTNPGKAREFYESKLGLRLLTEDSYGMEFEVQGAGLRVSNVEKLTPQPFTVLGWNTPDIVEEIRILNEKGIAFEHYGFIDQDGSGIWTAPGGTRVAWFKDPDGNLLSLSD
jgi:catechol 2,3-dioxygenase-like lactoylglutathione lyase family enzyme